MNRDALKRELVHIARRQWYTNHGPLLQALERELGPRAVGLCNVDAGAYLYARATRADATRADRDRSVWIDPASGLQAGAFRWAGWSIAATASEASLRVGAAGGPRAQLVGVPWRAAAPPVSSELPDHADGLLIETDAGGIAAPGAVLVLRDPHVFDFARTARNHHVEQSFAPVDIRFNFKMSEIQALVALAQLVPASRLRGILQGLAPE